jgi:diaminopimelate epimerase
MGGVYTARRLPTSNRPGTISPVRFTKMHGAGNDYVYVDLSREKVKNPSAFARAVSDRHTGVGSDGLILIAPSKKADFRMIMYNADGSRAEMCGNGIRCIGKYVYDHGRTRRRELAIETAGDIVRLKLHVNGRKVDRVTVDMGPPRGGVTRRKLKAGDRTFDCRLVSMGNPHCVIVIRGLDRFPVERYGKILERHRAFPERTNVEFVEALSRKRVRQRTWERGSGETLACGSGACAVAAALHHEGRIGRRTRIELLGGALDLEIAPGGSILMTGPAVEVFSGEWPTAGRRRR